MKHPKPRILGQLSPERSAVIEASAGTGKTFTLEHWVVALLLETDVTLDQILVVTFTEKAASELKARLRKKFTSLLEDPPSPLEPDQPSWIIDPPLALKLTKALASFDAASISTIHAFCQRMLVENAFAHRRLFEQVLIDGRMAFHRSFLGALRTRFAREPHYRIWLEHWLANNSLDALFELIYEVQQRRGQVRPHLDLAALGDALRDLARVEVGPAVIRPALQRAQLDARAIFSVMRALGQIREPLRRFVETQHPADFIADTSATESVAELQRSLAPLPDILPLVRLRDALGRLVPLLVPFSAAVVQVFLPELETRAAHDKAARGELDFADMLGLLAQSLEGPDGQALVTTLRQRYRFALIDEFQDTDEIQWSIFRRVFLEAPGHALYVIGDPKQAIYSFRGADVHTYLNARATISDLGGNLAHLTDNYRSTAPLVAALNAILDQSAAEPFFKGRIQYDHPVVSARGDRGAISRGGQAAPPVHLFELHAPNGRLTSNKARKLLSQRIAQEIVALLAPGGDWAIDTDGGPRPLSAKEIFVLTRSVDEGIEVAGALADASVPHAFYKQDGLFQTPEAAHVRDLLTAIADPHDRAARAAAFATPFFAAPLERLLDYESLPPTHTFWRHLLAWRELAEARAYDRLFARITADSRLAERILFTSDRERALTNYQHIFEVLLEEVHRLRAPLPELLRGLSAFIDERRLPAGEDGNVQRLESEREAVQIMTMHKAKGLEASVVFLFGGFDEAKSNVHLYHDGALRVANVGGAVPDAAKIEAEEEDQRLLYVALTRAKARLYLPYVGFSGDDEPTREHPLKGCLGTLVRTLDRLIPELEQPQWRPLFSRERLTPKRKPRFENDSRQLPLDTWSPPSNLLNPPPEPFLADLAQKLRGPLITSYSALKQSRGGHHSVELEPTTGERHTSEIIAEDELPPGTASGRLLHEVLEQVPLASLEGGIGAELWGARADIRPIFLESLRRHGRSERHLPHAVRLVHRALTQPLVLGDFLLPQGIASASRVVRELEFLFSLPKDRGFVKGFIDVVLEVDDRVIVLDWKSDLLPRWDQLDAHVAENYALQAELYTLALVKLYGLDASNYEARFGGVAYCFVRGLEHGGVYYARPSWSEIEASLARLEDV